MKGVHWLSRLHIHAHYMVSVLLLDKKSTNLTDSKDINSLYNGVMRYLANYLWQNKFKKKECYNMGYP